MQKTSKNWVISSYISSMVRADKLEPQHKLHPLIQKPKAPDSCFLSLAMSQVAEAGRGFAAFPRPSVGFIWVPTVPQFSQNTFMFINAFRMYFIYRIGSQVHIPHYSLLWNFDNVLKTSFHFIKYSFSWLFFLTIQYSIFFFTGLPWESIYLVCFVPTANY